MEQKRNIGLEIFRILSMLLIILLHSTSYSGGPLEKLIPGNPLYWYEWFIYALVQVCVNSFVLISGYFLVSSKFRPEKLVLLWIQVVFYSFFIKIILMALGEIPFSIVSLVSCFVPVLTGRYWFVTIYFGMYLLSPFLNLAVGAMTKRQHGTLVALLFFLSSVMVSIYPSFRGMNSGGGWGVAWFVVLYLTAAYLRLYYQPKKNVIQPALIFLACPAVMTIALWLAQKSGIAPLVAAADNWWRYDSVPVFVASVALMAAFLNYTPKEGHNGVKKGIVALSSATFGVYLIHAHADICTEAMWQRIGMVRNMGEPWFPLYQLLTVILIFVACALIDLARQWLFRKGKVEELVQRMVRGLLRNRSNLFDFPFALK